MNATTKRALLQHMNSRKRGQDADMRRMHYDGDIYYNHDEGMEDRARRSGSMRMGYDDTMEDKFRDSRGREHYNNGRYAPMNEGGSWLESRHRDSRGRYAAGMHYDGGDMGGYDAPGMNYGADMRYYPGFPSLPPVYERGARSMGDEYPRMNKIGFDTGATQREAHHDYRTSAGYEPRNEMEYRRGATPTAGYASRMENPVLTREMAEEWVNHMKNADGTTGPHWTMEQTENIREKYCPECDGIKFFVALNAVYSDMVKFFQKHNINSVSAYVDAAKAFWLEDEDAVSNKLAAYYDAVVKH